MAKQRTISFSEWLQVSLRRVCLVHFCLIGAYIIQTIVMDAWHVIVPEVVLKRWVAASILLVITAALWYLAHNRNNSIATYKRLIFGLITADICMAAYNVYLERGMASKAVLLFAIPIAVSAVLLSRSALFATAAFSVAGYAIGTVTYFVLHFNEGYKTELYSIIGFYAACLFIVAALLSIVVRFGGATADS